MRQDIPEWNGKARTHIDSHWILIMVLAENGVTNIKTIILNYVDISHHIIPIQ